MKKTQFIPRGVFYSVERYIYRTQDGKRYWEFSYLETEHGFEVDIHQWPSYEGRGEGSIVAHWLPSPREGVERQICFSAGKNAQTIEEAQQFSMTYADLSSEYVDTGISIDALIAIRDN